MIFIIHVIFDDLCYKCNPTYANTVNKFQTLQEGSKFFRFRQNNPLIMDAFHSFKLNAGVGNKHITIIQVLGNVVAICKLCLSCYLQKTIS